MISKRLAYMIWAPILTFALLMFTYFQSGREVVWLIIAVMSLIGLPVLVSVVRYAEKHGLIK